MAELTGQVRLAKAHPRKYVINGTAGVINRLGLSWLPWLAYLPWRQLGRIPIEVSLMYRPIACVCLFVSPYLLWAEEPPDKPNKGPEGGFQEMPKELEKKLGEASQTANSGASMPELLSFVRATTVGLFLILGLAVAGQLLALIIARKTFDESPVSARIFGLTIVVFLACLMPAIGFSGEQMAPAYGLLGLALGYIFGKGDKTPKVTQAPQPPAV